MRMPLGLIAALLWGCAAELPAPPPHIAPQWLNTAPDVQVCLATHEVRVQARVCLGEGPLEQVVCAAGTREHEAIFAVAARPSDIHAALLLAGGVPGRPGSWSVNSSNALVAHFPEGTSVEVLATGPDKRLEPVQRLVRALGAQRDATGELRFVFAGSLLVRLNRQPDSPEVYAADLSGSVVGLVTFGDELIACASVMSDSADVQDPAWEVFTERVWPEGSAVTLTLRAIGAADANP